MRVWRKSLRLVVRSPAGAAGGAGFALPWTMFVLLMVSLLAAGGFLVTWLEGQSARAFARATQTFFVAEGGLVAALEAARGPNPALSPVDLGGGTATVTFEPLIDLGAGETLFRVASTGAVVAEGVTFERTVGQVLWVAAPPRMPGAVVLNGGVVGAPPEGTISGLGGLGTACPQQPSPVAGIAYWGGAPPTLSPTLEIYGSPAVERLPTTVSVAAETGIRWDELLADWGPRPDATVPPDAWPAAGSGGGWPSIRIPGSVTLGGASNGRGALVVEGDLTLGDGFAWRGLILVGGALVLDGNVSIRGTVASGLAGGGAAADFGGHTIDARFDPCAVASAAERLTAPAAALPGTWYEEW